jgi:polysaccharide pyruvyl transferase CsaB
LKSEQVVNEQVILCGYYGFGNGGDEALLASLLQMLPPSVTPLVMSADPEFTQRQYGVAAFDRNQPQAVWQALRQSQGFIWGGGSLIQDATSALSPVYYCTWMKLAQILGLKTVAWAQGVGPLKRPIVRWLARQVFSGCSAVSVRDPASAALVQSWGIAALQAPDPVWALAAQPWSALDTLPPIPIKGPKIAVSLRSHPLLTPERLALFGQALEQFQQASQCQVLLMPFQASQDLAIAKALHQQLPQVSQVVQTTNPRQLKGIFREVELVLGMRLHALIMAAAEGARCFALSYDPKVNQLMQTLDLPGWSLDQMPPKAIEVADAWLAALQRQPVSAAKIAEIITATHQHADLLAEIFAANVKR